LTQRFATIEVAKEAMNFSAAHFTIFNATDREDLHGHNFQVACQITAALSEAGLLFDYGIIKRALRALCDEIDEKVLLPEQSPHLQISEEDGYVLAQFNGERIPFLPRDVLTLPIANTTVEEFSRYFLDRVKALPQFQSFGVTHLILKVASSPGQWGIAEWQAS
jgi:6-pyruvoyltetrahydropterin/6-carboxytetrahydropterin synthase